MKQGHNWERPRWHGPAILVAGILAAAALFAVAGCGDNQQADAGSRVSTVKAGSGKLYVAVTGSGELQARSGNMGMAIIDLGTKQVEQVNLTETKAPHGIIFGLDTDTMPGSNGRVAGESPKTMLMGNAEDGMVVTIDLASRKVIKTAAPPAGAKLAICGMYRGPDGKLYLASMGD